MEVKFGDRVVGDSQPPYIIAEIGSNHNGDIELAKTLIEAAHRSGADAVKFQSWSAQSLISKGEYEANTDYADKKRHFGSLKEMVEEYQLTHSQHHELADYCRSLGVDFMSSAFAPAEVDLLVELGVPAIKIASMDVTHLPLLEYAAKSGKPLILSTGLSSIDEIAQAVRTIRENGCEQLVLLHCISIYPPEMEDVRLKNIPMLQEVFELPVGFSDHTMGTAIPLASVALGACLIEKHFTIDQEMEGWDHWISATPEQMEVLARESKNIHTAIGSKRRIVSEAEMAKRMKFRRCIVAKRDLKAGHVLTINDLDYKRPGDGIHPPEYRYLVGRKLRADVPGDHKFDWSDFE